MHLDHGLQVGPSPVVLDPIAHRMRGAASPLDQLRPPVRPHGEINHEAAVQGDDQAKPGVRRCVRRKALVHNADERKYVDAEHGEADDGDASCHPLCILPFFTLIRTRPSGAKIRGRSKQ